MLHVSGEASGKQPRPRILTLASFCCASHHVPRQEPVPEGWLLTVTGAWTTLAPRSWLPRPRPLLHEWPGAPHWSLRCPQPLALESMSRPKSTTGQLCHVRPQAGSHGQVCPHFLSCLPLRLPEGAQGDLEPRHVPGQGQLSTRQVSWSTRASPSTASRVTTAVRGVSAVGRAPTLRLGARAGSGLGHRDLFPHLQTREAVPAVLPAAG